MLNVFIYLYLPEKYQIERILTLHNIGLRVVFTCQLTCLELCECVYDVSAQIFLRMIAVYHIEPFCNRREFTSY